MVELLEVVDHRDDVVVRRSTRTSHERLLRGHRHRHLSHHRGQEVVHHGRVNTPLGHVRARVGKLFPLPEFLFELALLLALPTGVS